ncbi:hypothetical protein GLOIN_2v1488787 [Rhizophagus irregularis DAOM 181602=DAOM 197198]|uniref:Uncharacterized protein n=1 Tax=Rhizophagus irregularis (strain DAOM 181602 / DAOM 197198 / MUCL 43194) TaxID=747089 RepID=A0A2P4NYN4_RHIID|nr:hypothetical protein GLOIN_2v1488787 [Rhizophagus irregularis DAOM 181602=DAOM 197198]POG58198.1 hypothetical protein GLOIN_2v1488787 [Rhizophagus irregularis DAOM 181602=DAOM 197198]|eukprot:XP_025165064.1 hypothetical protein GLOIN_2v1488787 [Rhizophagus irregularis DAOM 181602=DAOM 197198]
MQLFFLIRKNIKTENVAKYSAKDFIKEGETRGRTKDGKEKGETVRKEKDFISPTSLVRSLLIRKYVSQNACADPYPFGVYRMTMKIGYCPKKKVLIAPHPFCHQAQSETSICKLLFPYQLRGFRRVFLKRTCGTSSDLGSVAESKARYPVNPQLWVMSYDLSI